MTTPLSRAAATAVRRFADSTSARITEAARSGPIVVQVTAVAPGAAKDGNALVTITWRGATARVNGYAASYTPVVGHRVVCDYIDNQLVIAYRVIGAP